MDPSREYGHDRTSDAPLALDLALSERPIARRLRLPPSWVGMSGYLAAGLLLAVLLATAVNIGHKDPATAVGSSANAVTDNVVRLRARELAAACWQGYGRSGPARLTVALEVGVDGKIRYAVASGETPALRSCAEAHVRSWEFLPQSQALTMALPFEIDPR